MDNTSEEKVDGRPTKAFFVDMLTRDISVTASILDLCDNALGRTFELADIDASYFLGAMNGKQKPLKPFYLHLKVTPSAISMEDNCGGISIDHAREDIFRLGKTDDSGETGLSVYGIGMKRAFFKLADHVSLRSSHKNEWFDITFDVSKWRNKGDDDWSLKFTHTGTAKDRPDAIPKNGTLIELKTIRPGVRDILGQKSFRNDLRDRLQSAYSLFVKLGLDLRLDGVRIESTTPDLADEPLKPARKTLKLDDVRAVLVAGLTPKATLANASNSGWFVYCNGRLVLDADKGRTTGWGDDLPQWHSKFLHFAGFVFFTSNNSLALPWTTTKQGVVEDSEVFIRAKQEMQVQARPVIDFLSRQYPSDVGDESVQERILFEKARPVSLTSLSKTDRAFVAPLPKMKAKAQTKIQYFRPTAQVERVREKLGKKLSLYEIGGRTFDYFYRAEIDE
jgi:hypothetical protein